MDDRGFVYYGNVGVPGKPTAGQMVKSTGSSAGPSNQATPQLEEAELNSVKDKKDWIPLRELEKSPVLSAGNPDEPQIKSKRPKDTAFRQQRLPAWQPVLTPYNVIPILFILAIVFIPIGVIFIIFTMQVQEYQFDYTDCLGLAPLDVFAQAPRNLGNVPFEWRRLRSLPDYAENSSPDFGNEFTPSETLCELRFTVSREISGPVLEYYRLSNYYQNQRLYVKSVSWEQLRGKALPANELADCKPLVGPDSGVDPATGRPLVYYPCGLIANSMFNDTIGGMVMWSPADDENPSNIYQFPPDDITWVSSRDRYGPSQYSLESVRPPPFWASNRRLVNPDGKYRALPDLQNDERFQNWMKVSGLPVFRKPYGKQQESIPAGVYTVLVSSVFEVASYGATKSLVISNTSWLGGQNGFLGYAYIAMGTAFLALAIIFLIKHLVAPRRLGDVRYLSWNQELPEE